MLVSTMAQPTTPLYNVSRWPACTASSCCRSSRTRTGARALLLGSRLMAPMEASSSMVAQRTTPRTRCSGCVRGQPGGRSASSPIARSASVPTPRSWQAPEARRRWCASFVEHKSGQSSARVGEGGFTRGRGCLRRHLGAASLGQSTSWATLAGKGWPCRRTNERTHE